MPGNQPQPLPAGLLGRIEDSSGLLLCLDYDGTLAEITEEPELAVPVPGISETLLSLAQRPKIKLALVTGRPISELKRLIGAIPGAYISGLHGFELETPSGEILAGMMEWESIRQELDLVRRWLSDNVQVNRGFRIEDKRVAIGLHYRSASSEEAALLAERFRCFIASSTRQLRVLNLKCLVEALPGEVDKGQAIATIKSYFPAHYIVAYFGDDATDEDAFKSLGASDVSVLVGERPETNAKYRVQSPIVLGVVLRELADRTGCSNRHVIERDGAEI